MSVIALFSDLSAHLQSPDFLATARHRLHPTAFTRNRKLPLPALVALLLTGMRKSVQAELDEFFAHLHQQAQLVHQVSAQAFAIARAKLSSSAIPLLNDWLIKRAEHYGFVSLWNGLRLVAADASTVRFGLRASHVKRAALADQIAFGLFLPGSELMLATSLHSVHESERQMLFEHLDRLASGDLLLLDRGYPCRWLVAVLNQRAIPFCMRVEKSGNTGFACVRDFLRSGLGEQIVTLSAVCAQDVLDFECPAVPQQVRLIRHIAPSGEIRVLMTNLFDVARFPASQFADLYHQRWRIEEAFKRLKHRLNLEHVSGLSQQAVAQDVAAKVLCDNLQALTTLTARDDAQLPASNRINHAYVFTALKPLLPALLLGKKVVKLLRNVLKLIAKQTYLHRENLAKPRRSRPKPHKHMAQKNC
jgi:Transposase DDE domain